MKEEPLQKRFLDELDRSNKQLDEVVRRRLPVVTSCATCTAPGCCSQKVVMPFHEALPIARVLKREGRDTPELRERLSAQADVMERTTRKAWLGAARACELLVDGRCSVYAARPFACRTYFAISPPENCQPAAENNRVEFINFGDLLGIALRRARQIHIALGLKETSKRVMIGVLPRMVLYALEVWESADSAAMLRLKKWPTDDDLAADWIEGQTL